VPPTKSGADVRMIGQLNRDIPSIASVFVDPLVTGYPSGSILLSRHGLPRAVFSIQKSTQTELT
jgi:hypothetical protein